MKYLLLILKTVIIEVFIIFIYIFILNNYIGKVKTTIKSDGIGYYDYLPSVFIYHDLNRKDVSPQQNPNLYNRTTAVGVYVEYKGRTVNKYSCGTAVLESPFFLYTLLSTHLDGNGNDGYQKPFQKTIFYSAIFYLFLSLLFLKLTLNLYKIKKYIVVLCQVLLALATLLTNYCNFDAAYSHVYSLFAISAFIFFVRSYFQNLKLRHFIFACIFFGLIILIRQINVMIIFFIPFLSGSFQQLKEGIKMLFKHYKILVLGIILVIGIFSLQCFFWYMQAGHFFIYSYQNEGFNFSDPHFFSILFSYKKGLFVYTPILFISVLGLIWLVYKRKFYLCVTWFLFFMLITFVLSSWWIWFYGSSFGMRVYIDFYLIFFILLALMLNEINIVLKIGIILISLLTIPVNLIQTYQYKEYILHWEDMTGDMYWKVFLKTSKKYVGLLWKKHSDLSQYKTVCQISLGNLYIPSNTQKVIAKLKSSEISEFKNVRLIQVLMDNDFQENDDSELIFCINQFNADHNYYWERVSTLRFADDKFYKWQTGEFSFELSPFPDDNEKILTIELISTQNNIYKNVRIIFMKHL